MSSRKGPTGFFRSLWRILGARPQVPASLQENEALAAVLNRRSVRSFSKREISEHVFTAILEAGRLAPSTVNLQTWSFAVFTPDAWRETFCKPMPFRGQRAVIVLADTHRARLVLDAFPQSPMVAVSYTHLTLPTTPYV